MSNVVKLKGAHSRMTVEQAINSAKELELTDVVIAGFDKDGDFCVRSSHMTRKDALWIAEYTKKHAMGELD